MDSGWVLLVDDDASLSEALQDLIRSVGLNVLAFGSVAEFLQAPWPDAPSCLVLDVRLPGQSGFDLQAELARRPLAPPVVFMSGHADVSMSVRAMKAGAIEFLQKPVREQDLLDAIQLGIERDRQQRVDFAALEDLRRRSASLTPREREVMALVATGRLNKQMAQDMGVGEVTVKAHRGQVMRKMGARSIADLVRMADRLGEKGGGSAA